MTEHAMADEFESPVLSGPVHKPRAVFGWSRRWPVGLSVLAMAIVAVLIYLQLDAPDPFGRSEPIVSDESHHAASREQLAGMASALALRLKSKPDDVAGWTMLARSYVTLGRYAQAAEAYSHLVRLSPGNAGLLADYADILAMSNNKSLLGEPQKLIAEALALDPKNVKALALSASASFQARDYTAALSQWKKILVLVPPESEVARSTMSSIGEAQNLAEQSGQASVPTPAAVNSPPLAPGAKMQ